MLAAWIILLDIYQMTGFLLLSVKNTIILVQDILAQDFLVQDFLDYSSSSSKKKKKYSSSLYHFEKRSTFKAHFVKLNQYF